MDHYKTFHGYHQFNAAPEVAQPSTFPEVATPESEGLQMVQPTYTNQAGHNHYYGDKPSAGPYASPQAIPERRKPDKRTIVISIIVAVIALVIGLGVGVGVGLSVGKSSDSSNQTSSPTNPGGTPSPTSSTVPTGPTAGVAAYTCQNGTQTTSSESVHYIEDCEAAYLTGGPDMYDTSTTIVNLANPPYTRYSLADCLDVCDEWNANSANDVPCRAITYYANLTQAYGNDWGGNCFVKNGRPDSVSRDGEGIDWEHTVSAYMSCLVNGGCG